MKCIEYIAMIAHDMGLIFEFLGMISSLPLLVLVIFLEWHLVFPMVLAPLVFLVLGYVISHVPHKNLEPSFSITLAAVALSWFAIALVGALQSCSGCTCRLPTACLR